MSSNFFQFQLISFGTFILFVSLTKAVSYSCNPSDLTIMVPFREDCWSSQEVLAKPQEERQQQAVFMSALDIISCAEIFQGVEELHGFNVTGNFLLCLLYFHLHSSRHLYSTLHCWHAPSHLCTTQGITWISFSQESILSEASLEAIWKC